MQSMIDGLELDINSFIEVQNLNEASLISTGYTVLS